MSIRFDWRAIRFWQAAMAPKPVPVPGVNPWTVGQDAKNVTQSELPIWLTDDSARLIEKGYWV